jgi:glycosyltransferase involved in cell wall biosynthesis
LGRPLEIVGTGPRMAQLKRLAGADVRFLGWLDRAELRDAYRRAAAVLVPNVEDFGMVTVEALATGTPVVGLSASGIADVVRPGIEGELADESGLEALIDATARTLDRDWDVTALRQRAEFFSRERFKVRFGFLLDRLGFGGALA